MLLPHAFNFSARHLLPLLQPYFQQLSWDTGALFTSSSPSPPSSCSIRYRPSLLTPVKSSIWCDVDLPTLMGTQVTLSWRFSRMPHFVSILFPTPHVVCLCINSNKPDILLFHVLPQTLWFDEQEFPFLKPLSPAASFSACFILFYFS